MSLSLREKQNLYHSLGQLLRSGIPLGGALHSLAQTSSGSQRRLIQRLNQAIVAGKSIGDAMAAERPGISELEVGIVSACEKSGRLEHGMAQLAIYHGALATAREVMKKRLAYPVFVLHFGVLALNLKTAIAGAGVGAYLREVLGILALFYGLALIVLFAIPLLRDAGATSALVDGLLRRIPLVGKIRRAFATSRFCVTYEMQLDAGINVINALGTAQRASMSGLIRAAVNRSIPEVRNGSQVGPLLAASGAFPEPMTRAMCIGEQTGELDKELARMADEYREEALSRLETLSEWVPRLIYISIVVYVGYTIVKLYLGYMSEVGKIMDSM